MPEPLRAEILSMKSEDTDLLLSEREDARLERERIIPKAVPFDDVESYSDTDPNDQEDRTILEESKENSSL